MADGFDPIVDLTRSNYVVKGAPFDIWGTGNTSGATLNQILQRTVVPDDLKLPSQSDLYGFQKARDQLASNGGGVIQMLPRSGAQSYAFNAMLDMGSDASFSKIHIFAPYGEGNYNADTGRIYATSAMQALISYTPGGNFPLVSSGLHNVTLDGNGLAVNCMTRTGCDGFQMHDVSMRGATDFQMVVSAAENYDDIFSRQYRVDINAGVNGKGLQFTSPTDTIHDVALGYWQQPRIQHANGIGFDQGSSDTNRFDQMFVQRTGGTGDGHVMRGGVNSTSAFNYVYENLFTQYFSTVPTRSEDTGRPGTANRFERLVVQSGTAFPLFQGASWGSWTATDGQEYRKNADQTVEYRDASGRWSYGRQASGNVRASFLDVGGQILELFNGQAAAGLRSSRWVGDGNGNLILAIANDAGVTQDLAQIVKRTASQVTHQGLYTQGTERLIVDGSNVLMPTLPTSATGLTSGMLYADAADGNRLKRVP